MPIYVCVKHVPDTGAVISLEGTTGFKEQGIKFVINPYDEFAIEEALQWAEKSKEEVVVVTLAKADATSTLHGALALGAARAIHVVTDRQFNNSARTAKAIVAAIRSDGSPTAVFTGKQSVDTEGMQLPYLLGRELNLPVVNDVIGIVLDGDTVTATRELGGGTREKTTFSRPCVIGATKGLNNPRYPKLPDIMKAKKKPIAVIRMDTLAPEDGPAGMVLKNLALMPEKAAGNRAVLLQGTLEERVAALRQLIKEKAGV